MKEALSILDTQSINFDANGVLAVQITLAIIMFGVALDIKFEHFKDVVRNPKAPIIGVISQFLFLPAVTFAVVSLMRNFITPSVALGMILVASCPGGNISNFMSYLAKGNAALSVSLTAIATLAAIFMTPLNFAFWGALYAAGSDLVQPITIDPIEMFKSVFILLGIPLVLGMTFAYYLPKVTTKIVKPIKNISILIFLLIVAMAFANNFDNFIKYIHLIFVIVLAHNIFALLTGYSLASIFRLSKYDRRSITIETGIQNSGLGLALLFNTAIFPAHMHEAMGGMIFITAWWGIWHILSGLGLAGFWSRIPLEKEHKFLFIRGKN